MIINLSNLIDESLKVFAYNPEKVKSLLVTEMTIYTPALSHYTVIHIQVADDPPI